MKLRVLLSGNLALVVCHLLLALLGVGWTASAAPQTNAAAKKATPLGTNQIAQGEGEIPKAVFLVPSDQKDGKDPFFPRSTRPYVGLQQTTTTTKTNATPTVVDLVLSGISGAGDKRLAIINYQTFGAGEEREIVTGKGRIKIIVLEIGEDSALVQIIGGERRELHLRQAGGLPKR